MWTTMVSFYGLLGGTKVCSYVLYRRHPRAAQRKRGSRYTTLDPHVSRRVRGDDEEGSHRDIGTYPG